ncbi:MAG: fumarylacetoacetate hydrolase family protein, partial [Candidatus Limnocylindrales bacterium]
MRLVSYLDQGRERLGLLLGERVVPARELLLTGPATMAELLGGGPEAVDRLRQAVATAAATTDAEAAAGAQNLGDVTLLAPVPRPPKIVAIGLNYRSHTGEQERPPPKEPMIFAKYPTAVIGPGAEIRWDPVLSAAVDFEGELAAVIGRPARRVERGEALGYLIGYTVANDVTARDLQDRDRQFTRGKSLDTFCPLGPALVTADEVPDPQALRLTTRVNGELLQDETTGTMIFDVAELIAFASRAFSLEPGDVILTGTPGGVGHYRNPPRYMHDGDEVAVEIEGLGRLVNRCREERVPGEGDAES